jgi:hypothetical protein
MIATSRVIEPEIYAVYSIVLERNISPQRMLKMWKDDDTYGSKKVVIRDLLDAILKRFWAQSGFNNRISDIKDVIKFVKKYNAQRFWQW